MCLTDQVLFEKVIIQKNKVNGFLMIWLKEPDRWLVGLWLSWCLICHLHALSDILAWACLIRADGNAGAGLCTLRAVSVLSEDRLCMEPAYRQLCTRSLVKRDEWEGRRRLSLHTHLCPYVSSHKAKGVSLVWSAASPSCLLKEALGSNSLSIFNLKVFLSLEYTFFKTHTFSWQT